MSLDIIFKTVKNMEETLDPFEMSAVSTTIVSSIKNSFVDRSYFSLYSVSTRLPGYWAVSSISLIYSAGF